MSQIQKLVAAMTANAAIVEEELRRSGQQEPSDDPLSSLEFPNIGPKGAKARVALLSAIHQLDRVIQAPVEYFRNFAQSCIETGCVRTLIGFNIPEMIPLDGRLTYDELSEKLGLSPNVLRTLVRGAIMSVGFLTENAEGRVGHTVTSSVFHPDRGQQDRCQATKWQTYAMLNCGTNLENALRVDPSAQNDHASAFAVAHRGPDGTAPNFWEYLEQNPEMGRWFHAAMRIVTTYPMRDTKHLVNGYDWATLHNKTVVEDLVEVVEEGRATAQLPSNVSLEVANFFEPQPRIADAYLVRTVFHDWSDSHCANIVRSLLPAFRHGARLIAEEIILPQHGALPSFAERNFRRADLIMTGLFNGRERTLEEYIELVSSVDERLVFQKSFHPLGSITSIMEWVFVDPEHKNGQASIVPEPSTIPAKEIEDTAAMLEEQLFPTPPLTPDTSVREKRSRTRLSIVEDHPIPAFPAGPLFPDASLTNKLDSSKEVLEIVDAV